MANHVRALFFLVLISKVGAAVPQTVSEVVLEKYLGLWHEIAHIPNRFQDNESKGYGPCTKTTAEYSLRDLENEIAVKNSCTRVHKTSGASKQDVANGVAQVVEGTQNAQLEVNFTGLAFLRWLGIGNGDYWILGLGPLNADGLYSWAFVGSPDLKFGWVLARNPSLSSEVFAEIWLLAERQGYSRDSFQVAHP